MRPERLHLQKELAHWRAVVLHKSEINTQGEAEFSKESKQMLHEKQLETALRQKWKAVAEQLKNKKEQEAMLLRKMQLMKSTLSVDKRKLKHLHVELIHEKKVVKRLQELNLKRREELLHMKQSVRDLIERINNENEKYKIISRKIDERLKEREASVSTRERRMAQKYAHEKVYWNQRLQLIQKGILRLKTRLAKTSDKVHLVRIKYHQAVMSDTAMREELKHVKRRQKNISHRLEAELSEHKKLEHDRYEEKREAGRVVHYQHKVEELSRKVVREKLALAQLKKQYKKVYKVQALENRDAQRGLTVDQRALLVAHRAMRRTKREVRKLEHEILLVNAALAASRRGRVRTFQQEIKLM